jgi:hypothetical protein
MAGLIPICINRMKRTFKKFAPTFDGGNTSTIQTTTLLFPYPECANAYYITTNASEWKLYGTNTPSAPVVLDTRTRQFGSNIYFTFTNTVYYSNYTFAFSQTKATVGSNAVSVSNLSLINLTNNILHPILNSNSNTYNSILASFAGGKYRGQSSTGGEFLQISFSSNVIAASYKLSNTQPTVPSTWKLEGKPAPNGPWTTLDTREGQTTLADGGYNISLPNQILSNVFRFTCNTVTGTSNIQLSSFILYDQQGVELTKTMTSGTQDFISGILPTNVICQTSTSNVLGYSPFINSNLWTGTTSDWFFISFSAPTSINKIYIESAGTGQLALYGNTFPFSVQGNFIKNIGNGINGIPSGTAYQGYYFIPTGGISVSNVLVIGKNGPLNPYIDGTTNLVQSRFGGVNSGTPESIQIELAAGTSNGSYLSIQSPTDSGIVSYNVQALKNTTWVTISEKSNLYGLADRTFSQQEFVSNQYTRYKFNIFETASGFGPFKSTAVVSNISVCFNSRHIIPPIPSDGTYTLPYALNDKTSINGQFTFSSSPRSAGAVDDVYNLFDLDMTTAFISLAVYPTASSSPTTVTSTSTGTISGDWFQVDFPSNVQVSYYTLTTSIKPNLAPKSWYLLGNTGSSWSNILSYVSGVGIQPPNQSNVYGVSNTNPFSSFRFICSEVIGAATNFELTEFALYDIYGRLIPKFTKTNRTPVGLYGGKYNGTVNIGGVPGEWVSLTFPVQVKPSFVNISSGSNKLPSNIQVYSGTSTLIGSYNYFIPTNSVTIPLVTSPATTFRIQACEMVITDTSDVNAFAATEIQFLDAIGNRMNSPLTVTNQNIPTRIVAGGPGNQSLTLNLAYSNTASYYSFKCPSATSWNICGSVDNSTFTQLDSRLIPMSKSDIFLYNISTVSTSYKYFKLAVSNTYNSASIAVSDFAVYGSSKNRLIKYNATSNVDFIQPRYGGLYDKTKGSQLSISTEKAYYGEWVTFNFPTSVRTDNVTISVDSTSSLLGFTILGANTGYWNTISIANTRNLVDSFGLELANVYDSTITGTFTISASSDVINPTNLFVMNSTCIMNRPSITPTAVTNGYTAPYVQIELPVPTAVVSYKIYIPSQPDVTETFGFPVDWKLFGSTDGSAWNEVHSVSRFSRTWVGALQFYTSVNTVPYAFYRLCVKALASDSIILSGLELLNSLNDVIYNRSAFIAGQTVQQVNSGKYSSNVLLNFTKPVSYSNIGIVVYKYTNEPYFTDGKLKINAVNFKPTLFANSVGTNIYYVYSNTYTDVVSSNGNDQYVQISSSEGLDFIPSKYSFTSNTANVWSLYGSLDGVIWDTLDSRATGSTKNRLLNTLGNGYSQYRLNIHSITNFTDATTDVSNLYITSVYGNPLTNVFTSNTQTMRVNLTNDSYANTFALLELKNGF